MSDCEEFNFQNKEEVDEFEKLLSNHMTKLYKPKPPSFSLLNAYDVLEQQDNGKKIFIALFDLKLNYMLLWSDFYSVGTIWNQYFSKGKLEGGSVLDSQAKFSGKMEIHRFNTSFIFRFRALWDKLMGFFVLWRVPDQYNDFCSSKSKKKKFNQLATHYDCLPNKVLFEIKKIQEADLTTTTTESQNMSIKDMLVRFDNQFRTPEAHGTGRLRKYSFTMESMADNPQIELMGYWNVVRIFVTTNMGSIFQ